MTYRRLFTSRLLPASILWLPLVGFFVWQLLKSSAVELLVNVPACPSNCPKWEPLRLGEGNSLEFVEMATNGHPAGMAAPERVPESISIMVATYGTPVKIVGGTLVRTSLDGITCRWKTTASRLTDNSFAEFSADEPCQDKTTDGAKWKLTIDPKVTGAPIAVWTSPLTQDSALKEQSVFYSGAPALTAIFPAGALPADHLPMFVLSKLSYRLPQGGSSRLSQLEFLWDSAGAWVRTLSIFALTMLAFSLFVASIPQGFLTRGWFGALKVAGATALPTSLALFFALWNPPLQGVDEPSHLLGYAQVLPDNPLPAEESAAFAKRVHAARLAYHVAEEFHDGDRDQPFPLPFHGRVGATAVPVRSPLAGMVWRAVRASTSSLETAESLLGLRLAGVASYSLSLLLICCFLVPSRQSRYLSPPILAASLLPMFPLFVGGVSDHSFLISLYFCIAAAVLAATWKTERKSTVIGLALGLSCGLSLAASRSALPLVPVWGLVLVYRVLTGHARAIRSQLKFWVAFGCGFSALALVVTPEYVAFVLSPLPVMSRVADLPLAKLAVQDWFVGPPLVALLGLLGELSLARIGRLSLVERFARRTSLARVLSRTTAGLLLTLVLGSLVASLFFHMPQVQSIEVSPPPPLLAYLREVVPTFLTFFRFSSHDFFLSASFLGVFGWLETWPPQWFLTFLVVILATGLLVQAVRLWQRPNLASVCFAACVGTGSLVSVILYATAAYKTLQNLHGRYLAGLGLILCLVSLAGFSVLLQRLCGKLHKTWPSTTWAEADLIAACLGVFAHAVCWSTILTRYFG